MADIAIFRINYKSDFILTLQSDAGWTTPFCVKFWTGAPSKAYYAYYDGMSYTHCAPVDGEPTKLLVQFDDHHLPIGDLKFQIGYHFTVADFPTSIEDEVINQAAVIINNDGEQQQVMLDFNGETAPEIQFSLPAYANEAQRIANEQARIAAEEQRVSNEEARIAAEQERQQNEQQRISREQQRIEQEQQRINAEAERVSDFASLKTESEAATAAANIAATLANEKAQLADDKAALAQAAATLANAKAQLAEDKANLAQQKADYAQTQGNYAKAQGDAAKTEAEAAHSLNEEVSHDEATRQQQEAARQQAEAQRVIDFNAQMQQQQTAYTNAEAARDTAFDDAETERDAKVDAKVADITNLQAQIGYFVCDTNADTAAKTIAAAGYALTKGGNIRIKMTNANTADSVTLNINSTGAKALFYNGTQASSTNSWEAGEVIEVYYDGSNYQASNTELKYQVASDITDLAVQQSSGTQTSVFYDNTGTLAVTGYASAYRIDLPAGVVKLKVTNALNSPYHARFVLFNNDTVVQAYKQADLSKEPFTINIPSGVNAIGINRSTRKPMFTVERIDTYVGLDGELLKDSSVTLLKLAHDVKATLMDESSQKYKMLLSLNDKEYSLRETILQYEVSKYNTNFPSSTTVWGREKYDNPIEILGMRIYEVATKTVTIFVYDAATLEKTAEKTVELVAGENIVYFDQPHVLLPTEYAGLTGELAGGFDNNQHQIGNYFLDLSTGEMTANKGNIYGYSVIYRSGGESKSNSVLYAKNFAKESNNGDFIETTAGTIVEGNSGITLSTNSYIYLNREYASNRTIRIIATLYTSSVLKLGYRNAKTSGVEYIATINCADGEISIREITTTFNVVNGKKYVIDLIKDDYIATLRITDYNSSAAIEVSRNGDSQNDFPAICLTSGISPIIEAYAIYSETSEPYIMFFGDSITDGAQTPIYNGRFLARFSDIIGRRIGKPYLTSGRGGGTISYITNEIVGRLFTEAKILRPKYAFVTIGTNGGNTIGNLSTLVKKMADYGVTVILNNVPTRIYNGAEVDITETNDLLQEIRNTFSLEGVKCELACSVNNDGVTTDTELFGTSQSGYIIHPNGEGHYQIYLRTFIDCPDIYTNAGVYPVPDTVPRGTTAERPANAILGTIYYDTTLDCHVWSTGEGTWMNKNGRYV